MTIMRMLGVPEEEREELVHQADAMVSWNDPEFLQGREPLEVIGQAIFTLHEACIRLCDERRRSPGDDLLTALVQAEVEGERLTDAQIASFFVLISVAGNDTTRHTTSHAMLALSENPDQRRILLEDLDARLETGVEEFVRWASPVMTFRRTATAATRSCSGQAIEAGQKVVLFYPSGNRDERAIERSVPLRRHPRPEPPPRLRRRRPALLPGRRAGEDPAARALQRAAAAATPSSRCTTRRTSSATSSTRSPGCG